MRTEKATIIILFFVFFGYDLFSSSASSTEKNAGYFNESRSRDLSQISGLSSAKITSILKDKKGFIWLGTDNGLNRYDGTEITAFHYGTGIPKLSDDHRVYCLFQDRRDVLWIGTGGGLFTYNYNNQLLEKKDIPGNDDVLIMSICDDKEGNIWYGSDKGLIKYNHETQQGNWIAFDPANSPESNTYSFALSSDRQGELWIGTWRRGIYRMNPITGEYIKFTTEGREELEIFQTGRISAIEEGPDGSLWFGGWGLGLLRIYPNRKDIRFYQHDDANPNTLNGNKIKALEFDEKGFLWIGIEESGLDKFAPETETFTHYLNKFQTTDIYEGPSIYSIMIDDQSLMWLGFRNDGVKIVPLRLSYFENYKNEKSDVARVFSLCESEKGLYMGVKGAIDVFNINGKTFTTYLLPNKETPISLFRSDDHTIYIGTYKGSALKLDTKTGKFSNLVEGPLNAELRDFKVECFYPLPDEKLLIGTQKGLYNLDLTTGNYRLIINDWVYSILKGNNEGLWIMSWGSFRQYYPQTGKLINYKTDAQGSIKSEYLTNDNQMYLGTDLGFYRQNLETNEIHLFNDIFPYVNNQVNAIVADNQRRLWFTSDHELICYHPSTGKFRTFNKEDGLPDMRFHDGVGIKLQNGNIVFGGDDGILHFDPLKIEERKNDAKLIFTRMSILNESLNAEDPSYPFDGDISELSEIHLKYRQNIITFNFALLSYINPLKHRYEYLLDGFNDNWFDLGNQNSVTFTNLDPGDYTLKIKAANEENNWGPIKELKIYVSPPLYQKWYAYVTYIVLFIALIYLIKQFYKNREKLKSRLKDEHMKFEKMKAKAKHESDFSQMRLKFFTNISHEFRTPLTLILGPLENFVKHSKWPTEEHLRLMHKNAERLQRLVTQILDFRSMESKSLKFEPSWGDVIRFVKETSQLFLPMAQQKHLHFKIRNHAKSLNAWFDRDKLEKVIYNLLSNALKHTQKGDVSIEINTYEKGSIPYHSKRWKTGAYEKFLELIVKDSGEGIPENKIPHIFDRFYHLHSNNSIQGTGIGLALTKELVQIHNGKIMVNSQLNEGSEFCVIIPLKTRRIEEKSIEHGPDLATVSKDISLNTIKDHEGTVKERQTTQLPTILIVEDNEDLRAYMQVEFRSKYEIIEAENGKIGLESAFLAIPDLVISDLIMPEMDGIELCRALKNDERTSHIPVVILTAHASNINKVRGYEIGADDYITKPFSSELLSLRVENLLKNRKDLQSKFSREVRLQPKDLPISSMDERFLTKAMEVVETNLNNSEFNADSFASEMCMSRVHLYRKLKALTDQSVSDFVKTARLKLAANLIGENKLTIKEAAYTVGFKDPKYFSKCFKQQFGVKPSEYHEHSVEDD